VRRYLEADGFPERAPTRTRRSQIEKYLPYIHQRFAAGCDNATQLWREVVAQGYRGKAAMVRRYVRRLRVRTKTLGVKQQLEIQGTAVNFKSPSGRRAAWWLIKEAGDLTQTERLFVEQLIGLCSEAARIRELAQSFRQMVTQQETGKFDQSLEAAQQSEITEFQSFAEGLNKDREAETPHSSVSPPPIHRRARTAAWSETDAASPPSPPTAPPGLARWPAPAATVDQPHACDSPAASLFAPPAGAGLRRRVVDSVTLLAVATPRR